MHIRQWTAALGTLIWLSPVANAEGLLGGEVVADVAEQVTPAVVSITTERTRRPDRRAPGFPQFFPGMERQQRKQQRGAGSGVVISSDGYIVTNNHVIEGADSIQVAFSDGRRHDAKLIGTDKPSDIALIKIDEKRLRHLEFGDSDVLRLGAFVLAIGNPFDVGQTVTMGIVSAKGRANIGLVDYENFIQTDAAINPGNSGGALVDLNGRLVGINTAIISRSGGAQGIGFAVPSNMVQPILDQIKSHGRVRRGWLGIGIQDLTPELANSMGLTGTRGVLVSDVMEDGPAHSAGLVAGDVILSVNGELTHSSAALRNRVALLGPDTKSTLAIIRDGKRKKLKVRLAEKDDKAALAAAGDANTPLAGLRVRELDAQLRAQLEVPLSVEGLIVESLQPGSSAARSGLRAGDVITSANRKKIRTANDLRKATESGADQTLLRIWRRGSYMFKVLR